MEMISEVMRLTWKTWKADQSLGFHCPADRAGVRDTPPLRLPWLHTLTDPIDEHPAAGVVPQWEDSVVGGVEEAQHRGGGQTAADLRALLPPALVVQ